MPTVLSLLAKKARQGITHDTVAIEAAAAAAL
jgi:hypothetical protein